ILWIFICIKRKRDIFRNGGTADQIKMLKDHSYIQTDLPQFPAVKLCDISAIDQHLSSGRRLKHIDHTDQGTLSGTAWTYNPKHFSILNGKTDIINCLKRISSMSEFHIYVL